MEHLDLNNLLNRKEQAQQLIDYLHYFEQNKHINYKFKFLLYRSSIER